MRASHAISDTRADGDMIVLRSGIHYITTTVALTPSDSGLVIQNYPHEEAWVSGGKLLKDLQWTSTSTPSMLYADLSGMGFSELPGLNTLTGGDGDGGSR